MTGEPRPDGVASTIMHGKEPRGLAEALVLDHAVSVRPLDLAVHHSRLDAAYNTVINLANRIHGDTF